MERGAGSTSTSTAAASLIGLQLRGETLSLRQHVFLMLEEPFSGPGAYFLSLLIRANLVLAAVGTTMESMEGVTDASGPVPWLAITWVTNALFTLEACARIFCYEPNRRAALRDAFVWIDVLTVLPFWVRRAASLARAWVWCARTLSGLRVLGSTRWRPTPPR